MEDAPQHSVEVEVKFDVDVDTPLPDFSGLPGVASVTAGERRALDARYLDTADSALARAGVALRRRTGGPDAGWHIKGPLVDGARVELHWALADAIPARALTELARMTGRPIQAEDLIPLARIRNDRTAYHLLDAEGGVVAELADDHVATTDERNGTERTWREWELELGPAGPSDPAALFGAAAESARVAGARGASSASKLARALGGG